MSTCKEFIQKIKKGRIKVTFPEWWDSYREEKIAGGVIPRDREWSISERIVAQKAACNAWHSCKKIMKALQQRKEEE